MQRRHIEADGGAGTIGRVITVLVPRDHLALATAAMRGQRLVPYDPGEPFPADGLDADVLVPPFLGRQVDRHVHELTGLRLVQLLTVGADTWLGRLDPSVAVSTARGAHSAATAEWVVGAAIAVLREFPAFVRERGEWRQRPTDGLFGKRVLVIGSGDVGEAVRRRLVANDTSVTMVARRPRAGVHGVGELPSLLPEHDVVVLIVPLTEHTTRLVDAGFLAAMPDGAVLVNAARGPVVDTGALVAELRSGRLRAALDVTDPEPLPPEHPLWGAPNVLITPHIGGSVHGWLERAYVVAGRQLDAFARGDDPPNLVRDGY